MASEITIPASKVAVGDALWSGADKGWRRVTAVRTVTKRERRRIITYQQVFIATLQGEVVPEIPSSFARFGGAWDPDVTVRR